MTEKPYAIPYSDIKSPFIVSEQGSFAEYILFSLETMPEIMIGSRVLIQDKRSGKIVWISATVIDLKAVSPFQPDRENLLYVEETSNPLKLLESVYGPHTHQPMLIKVRLDSELMEKEDTPRKYSTSAVQRPPSASSSLTFPDLLPTAESKEPSLQELLDIRQEGIVLGTVGFGNIPYESDDNFLEYRWDINNLDNKHIFIVGESGSGKTVLLKNLALQIRLQNSKTRMIMTDTQGDITQLIFDDIVPTLEAKGWQKRFSNLSKEKAIDTLKPFQLIVPVTKPENPQNVRELIKLARNRGAIVKEIGMRLQDIVAPSDVEYLFRVQSEQVALLLDEEASEIESRDRGFTIAVLREAVNARISRASGGHITSAGGTIYYQSTAFAALRALKNLENYFDFHQPSMEGTNPLDCLNFDGTTIIFLEHLSYDEKIMWEMQLVNWLYAHKREDWEAFVFVDEAHQIVPARPQESGYKGTFNRLRSTFEKLSREGRKFGINLVLSTQSPRDLHHIVPEQCQTRIVMKIDPKNAKACFLETSLAFIANRFGQGQFWLMSPFNGSPDWVRIHSGAPPLPHSSMTPFWAAIKQKAIDEK